MKGSSAFSLALASAAATAVITSPASAATQIPFTITNSDLTWIGSPPNITSRTLSGSGEYTFNTVIQNGSVSLSDVASFVADLTYTVNINGGSSLTGVYHFTTSDLASLSGTFSNYLPTSFFDSTSAVSPTSGTLTVPLSLSIDAPVIPNSGGLSVYAYPNGTKTLIATGGIQASVIGYPGAVPEASTWAMMLVGLGIVATALRRSRKAAIALGGARLEHRLT